MARARRGRTTNVRGKVPNLDDPRVWQELTGEKKIKTRRLGPVGGRIVAETFAGLLLGDSSSYLSQNPLWTPTMAVNGVFGLRELIASALS